jgi:DNA-binding protein H-NS
MPTLGDTVTTEDLRTLNIESLLDLRRQIDAVLSERKEELERQLEQIIGRRLNGHAQPAKPISVTPKRQGNTKVVWRYRSRKDPTLRWSGRGLIPRWMREEMKGTKLGKDDFRVTAD